MGSPVHICHLSILNPAIHSRIFFKMARSQVRAGYKVSIVAQDPARAPYLREGVQIVPAGVFGRLSWNRFWAPRRVARLAKALEPDVIQVHTVELLAAAKKLKATKPRMKVIYDMHEDYAANVLHADYYGNLSKPRLIARIREAERDFGRWGDGLLLAEECFKGLISFDPDREVVVRNKFQAPEALGRVDLRLQDPSLPLMLHTGTLAENWGVFSAIELWRQLNRTQAMNLVIAGHSQDAGLISRLEQLAKESGFAHRFQLIGGREYVPFEDLVALMRHCTFGLALYQLKENIIDRIPTKFYEFMAQSKPLIYTENPSWEALNARTPFGIAIPANPMQWSADTIWSRVQALGLQLKRKPAPQAAWSWETEAEAMLQLIRKITN